MKKAFVSFILFAVVVSLFAGCRSVDLTLSFEPLSDEAKALIDDKVSADQERRVDWEGTGWNEPYYGTINGFAIVQASRGYLVNNTGYTGVAGYGFKAEGYFFELYAYRDGKVYTLFEVYKNGWLTKEQIGIIHERHQQIHEAWFQDVASWPSDLDPDYYYPDTFPDAKKEELTALLLTKYSREIDWDSACKYTGVINGFDVFMIVNYGTVAGTIYCTLEVADCKFQWDDPFMIYLYRDKEIYKLEEVYEKGWLRKEHVEQIHEEHNKAFGDQMTLRG